jgi:hypothetical protein
MPDGVGTTEAILQNYFIDRMTTKEIAEHYNKSQRYINKTIKHYKSILIENIKKSVPKPSLVKVVDSTSLPKAGFQSVRR